MFLDINVLNSTSMLIHLSSSIQYMHPLSPSFQGNKIKEMVNFIAIAVLFLCTAILVYNYFWKQRKIQQQPAQNQPKQHSPGVGNVASPVLKKSASDQESIKNTAAKAVVNPHRSPLDIARLSPDETSPQPTEDQSVDKKPAKAQTVPVIEKKDDVENSGSESKIKKVNAPPAAVIVPKAQLNESEKDVPAPVIGPANDGEILDVVPQANNLEVKKDIPLDTSLTMEQNIEGDLKNYLKQEENKYSCGGMFYRYEGVYAALKDLENNKKSRYVDYCNRSFVNHVETVKNCTTHWDINLSIDPDQRLLAWKILSDELDNTSLCITGQIHSSEKCQPGKEIVLQFFLTENDTEIDLLHFLTLLGHHLSQEMILIDSRSISQEPLLGIIPTDSVPPYFSYGTDTFTVVDDDLWDDLLAGRQNIVTIEAGKVVKIDNDPVMIKASHYRTMGDARVNPLSIPNPFEKLKITSLNK